MDSDREWWAVVLAAGEGNRLRSLTTDSLGNSIPKQFCSLNGGSSLLQLALRRAARIASWPRITTVVAVQHENWWTNEIPFAEPSSVVVQPSNRGTALGVLLPLLRILERDPDANVVLWPSDHFVADENVLEGVVRDALGEVAKRSERVVLLGIVPDQPETGFGWIVPADEDPCGARRVLRFVEKPPADVAVELMSRGGVWNSFILAASGRTIVELFEAKLPDVLATLRDAVARDSGIDSTAGAVAQAYEQLGNHDFCRDVLEGLEHRLSVLPVPQCGWTDLGTPERVARCVDAMTRVSPPLDRGPARLDLAQASLARRVVVIP